MYLFASYIIALQWYSPGNGNHLLYLLYTTNNIAADDIVMQEPGHQQALPSQLTMPGYNQSSYWLCSINGSFHGEDWINSNPSMDKLS